MEIVDNKEVKSTQKIQNSLDPSDAHKKSTSTDDHFTTESRKMIREGKYKKAFRFIDQYYTGSKKLGTVIKIKTCRRLLASLSAICSRKFVKEIQKPENFIKLLENGNYYLEQWHQNLIHFAKKTNQQLNTAGLVLNDLSANSSLEDLPHSASRFPGKNILKNESSTPNKRETQRKSHLLQILKIESRDRQSDQISNTSLSDLESSRKAAEELMPEDLNVSFYLDEYLCYFLTHIMNWGLYHKKLKNWNSSYRYFMFCLECSRKLESSANPLVLYTCARVRIPLASMYMEYEKHVEAQETLESALNILQMQFTIRDTCDQTEGKVEKKSSILKINRSAKLMIIILTLLGKNYQLQDNYSKVLESYKIANWFCKTFLQKDHDELVTIVHDCYVEAKEEFGQHLEEIGEMERVLFGDQIIHNKQHRDNQLRGNSSNTFEKLQETLYKRFNHSSLNRMKIPVKISSKTLGLKTSADEFSDIPSNPSHMKSLRNSLIELKTPLESGIPENKTNSLKTLTKSKKSEPKFFICGGKTWKQVPNEKWKLLDRNEYNDDVRLETKIVNTQLSEHQQQQYASMLNRNIRNRRLKSESSESKLNKTSQEYIDIDSFFQNHVESKIINDQEERTRPEGFDRIVKSYANFLKSEELDQKEFKFGDKMINLKYRENLGENPEIGKYQDSKVKLFHGPQFEKEKREVETAAYFIQTQTQAENTIKSRINLSKRRRERPVYTEHSNLSSFFKGSTHFGESEVSASTLLASPLKIRPTESIEEQTKTDEKAKLAGILLKHKRELNLQTLASALKESAHQTRHSNHQRQVSSTQATDAGAEDISVPEINEKRWKNISLMVKNRLTGMMENIQSEIKSDETIKSRLKLNQPIIREEKPKERVLKKFDELASSTNLLSVRRDAGRKGLELSEVVAIQTKIKAAERKKESVLSRKSISPFKTIYNQTQDSTNFSISVSKHV